MKKKYITPKVYSKHLSSVSLLAASYTIQQLEYTKEVNASHDYDVLSKRGERIIDDYEEE